MNNKDLYKSIEKDAFPNKTILLDCPNCHTPILSENINIHEFIANCHHCNSVFSYLKEVSTIRIKPSITLPDGMELLILENELEIKYKWRKNKNSFNLNFTFIWLAVWIPIAFIGYAAESMLAYFVIACNYIAGLFMVYNSLSHLFNTTIINVDSSNISIVHQPFQMLSKQAFNIKTARIEQLYVDKYIDGQKNNKNIVAYQVKGILQNSKEIVFVKGLKTIESAQFIEQEIENFLQIPDKKVPNEVLH